MALNIVALSAGAIAFGMGWYQWRKGLAWQRAAKGRELIDDLFRSNDSDQEYYAWDAMKILDYAEAERPLTSKLIDGRRHPIAAPDIALALAPNAANETNPKLLYVRECFDELYFKLGQLQDAIDSDLVRLDHVSGPLDYYVDLLARHSALHAGYLRANRYTRALAFLANFPVWRKAQSTPPSG